MHESRMSKIFLKRTFFLYNHIKTLYLWALFEKSLFAKKFLFYLCLQEGETALRGAADPFTKKNVFFLCLKKKAEGLVSSTLVCAESCVRSSQLCYHQCNRGRFISRCKTSTRLFRNENPVQNSFEWQKSPLDSERATLLNRFYNANLQKRHLNVFDIKWFEV